MKQLIFLAMLVLLVIAGSASASVCSIDVYGLTVSADGRISASIKNTGSAAETVFYNFYVNGVSVIGDPQIRLNPGETRAVSYAYPFSDGTYDVGISAIAACGASDTETIKHIVLEKYSCRNPYGFENQEYCDRSTKSCYACANGRWRLKSADVEYYCQTNTCSDSAGCGTYAGTCLSNPVLQPPRYCEEKPMPNLRCAGSVRQQEFQNADCSKNWVSLDYCPYGCSEGVCIPFAPAKKKTVSHEEPKPCGVSIENVYYATSIIEGTYTGISIELLNTANEIETIEITLYVDGIAKKYLPVSAAPNAAIKPSFEYTVQGSGWHAVSIDAKAKNGDCKSSDFIDLKVYALPRMQDGAVQRPTAPAKSIVPEKPAAAQIATDVKIYPHEIDCFVFDGSVITVEINSGRPQDFSISVVGVPYDWASYSRLVHADGGGEKSYIYLTPKKLGKAQVLVSVTALGEGKTFTQNVNVFALDRPDTSAWGAELSALAYPSQPKAVKSAGFSAYETVSYSLIFLLIIMVPLSFWMDLNLRVKKPFETEPEIEI